MEKYIKDIEQTDKKIEKKEKETAALRQRRRELNELVIQSVLKENNITIAELVGTINEIYAPPEPAVSEIKEVSEDEFPDEAPEEYEAGSN
ncbi:MAG: hypothetical protein LUD81_00200 [Clostridiales bacterium]|nr:hypothetical protein [Clostridiales bacterium]